jgi:hypothetical protein
MHTFVLTDWITVRGSNNTVNQSESEWLDMTQYEDLFFWIDVKEVTGAAVTLNIQTSPTKDEAFFTTISNNTTLGVNTLTPSSAQGKCLMSSASVPVARYVRWQLTSANTPFDATFRIMISANAPGA